MENEKRLIDANELVRKANKLDVFYFTGETDVAVHDCQMVELGAVLAEIDDAPTVDAVEVVHGYVLPAEEPKKVLLDMKCGICDQLMLSTDCYCPMCGTKMDGERKDNG